MKKVIPRLVLLLFTLAETQEIKADIDTIPYFWFTAGGGAIAVQNNRWEMSTGFSANVAGRKQMIGCRAFFSQELVLFTTPLGCKEYSVYYGRHFRAENDNSYATVGTGISLLQYTYRGERYFPQNSFGSYYYLEKSSAMGLCLDAQAGVNFGRFCGMGIRAFASLNPKHSIGGAVLEMRIGYVGER